MKNTNTKTETTLGYELFMLAKAVGKLTLVEGRHALRFAQQKRQALKRERLVSAPVDSRPAVDLDQPTLCRKLGKSEFEVWQHLNGVIETPDTAIHTQAYNLDMAC